MTNATVRADARFGRAMSVEAPTPPRPLNERSRVQTAGESVPTLQPRHAGRPVAEDARVKPRVTRAFAAQPKSVQHQKPPSEPKAFERRMCQLLEMAQQKMAENPGMKVPQAIQALRDGLLKIQAEAPPAALAQGLFDLYGMYEKSVAEPVLAAELSRHPSFAALDVSQVWRLCIDQRAWGAGQHQGLAFDDEPGYIGGMYTAFAAMLRQDLEQPQSKLDAGMLQKLHDLATEGVVALKNDSDIVKAVNRDTLPFVQALTAPVGLQERAWMAKRLLNGVKLPAALKSMRFIASGYAKELSHFGLKPNSHLTQQGWSELLQRYNAKGSEKHFQLINWPSKTQPSPSTPWESQPDLVLYNKTPQNVRVQCAEKILQRCTDQTNAATSADDKLRAIARCCQDLEQHHLFTDGNARTVGFLALNKLLLENNLKPCMFSDPNAFDGHSEAELVALIKRGQETFLDYAPARTVDKKPGA